MDQAKKHRSWLQLLRATLRRLLDRERKPPAEPSAEPFAEILAPVRRGPKGRSGAAVAEPPEESYGFFPPRTK